MVETEKGARNDRPALLDVVLVAPQIPMNTGNIIRLCANVGARLHLVEPLGFSLDSAAVRRGGLDYHELVEMTVWDSWSDCRTGLVPGAYASRRWFATTAAGSARRGDAGTPRRYDTCVYEAGDVVVFGCEATGLAPEILAEFAPEQRLSIPMRPNNRSLNIANAVAVVTYEAWRQHGFPGAADATALGDAAPTFSEGPRPPRV